MIFLKELYLKNFKSYTDIKINFSKGNNVIIGPNGSGKTSIFEAILYALYNRVPNKKIEDLVRRGTVGFLIRLNFEIGKDIFQVERENWAKQSRQPTAILKKNGVIISERQETVTNDIKDILKIDQRTFENVVYIGQGEIPQIAQETLGSRKNLFDKFLGLEIYESAYSELHNLEKIINVEVDTLRKRTEELSEDVKKIPFKQLEISDLEKRFDEKKSNLKKLQYEYNKIQQQFMQEEKKKYNIIKLEENKDNKEKEIDDLKTSLNQKQKNIEKILQKKIELSETELKKIFEQLNKKKEDIEMEQTNLERFIDEQRTYDNKLNSIDENLVKYNEILVDDKITKDKNINYILNSFPKLKNKLISDWKELLTKKNEEVKDNILKLIQKQEKVVESEKVLANLNSNLSEIEKNIKKNQTDLSENKKDILKINKNWEKLYQKIQNTDFENKINIIQNEIDKQDKIFGDLTIYNRIISEKISDLELDLEKISNLEEGAKCVHCKQIVTGEHKNKIMNDLKTTLEDNRIKLTDNENKLKIEKEKMDNFKKKYDNLNSNYKLKLELAPKISRIQEIEKDIDIYQSKIKELNFKIKEKNIEEDSSTLRENIQSKNEERLNIDKLNSKIDSLIDLNKSIEKNELEFEKLKQEKNDILKIFQPHELNNSIKRRSSLKNELRDISSLIPEVENLKERLVNLKDKQNLLQNIISKLNEQKKNFNEEQYQNINDKKEILNQNIGEINKEIELLAKEMIPNAKKDLTELEKKERDLKIQNDNLTNNLKKQKLTIFIRNFFRRITPVLRIQYTNQISSEATKLFLELMSSGEYDSVKVTPEYDLLVSRFGQFEDISALSGGEQVLICLAIRMAISEVLAHQGLILLDEPTSYLDEIRIKELIRVFETVRPVNQMITITHDSEFEKIADYTLKVSKKDGISYIDMEQLAY